MAVKYLPTIVSAKYQIHLAVVMACYFISNTLYILYFILCIGLNTFTLFLQFNF